MARIPFDIKYRPQIESGEYKVETRSGLPARIVCWNRKSKDMEILALVYDEHIDEDNEELAEVALNGRMFPRGKDHDYDLFVITPEEGLTEFEEKLVSFALQCGGQWDTANEEAKKWSREFLDLAMTDLEKTFECNLDKLPKWLKDKIEGLKFKALIKGYNKGYKDAEKQYNESVAYHFSIMPQRPLCYEPGGTCTNPQMDCINCPRKTTGGEFNTSSGTSTAKAEG